MQAQRTDWVGLGAPGIRAVVINKVKVIGPEEKVMRKVTAVAISAGSLTRRRKKPAIRTAVEHGNEELAAKFVAEEAGIEPTWKECPLSMQAAVENETDIMRLLLQHKANFCIRFNLR